MPNTCLKAVARFPAVLLGLLVLAACSDDDPVAPRTTYIRARADIAADVPVTTQTTLAVQGFNGSIMITGVRTTSPVSIRGEKYVGSDSLADAEAWLDSVRVVTATTDSVVTVRTSHPDDWRVYGVDYVIEVPAGMALEIRSTNGPVALHDIPSDVFVRLENGLIELENVTGSADLDLVNGGITADLVLPPGGTALMEVSNGSIDLAIPQATSASFLAVVSIGDLSVTDLTLADEVVTPHAVRGTLGEGDGEIDLNVNIGSITVRGI